MSGKVPFTRILIRVLEIAGAGLTSALVAYLLGRTEPQLTVQPATVVHLAPSDEEMIRTVRHDQAALLDQLRNDAQSRNAQPGPTQAAAAQANAAQAGAVAAPQEKPAASVVTASAPARSVPAPSTPAQAALAKGAQLAQIASAAPVMPPVPQPDVAVSAMDLPGANLPESASGTPPTSGQPKSTKASQQAHREAKPERLHLVEPRVRTAPRSVARVDDLQTRDLQTRDLQARPVVTPAAVASVPAAAPGPAAPPDAGTSDSDPSNRGLVAALRGFTSRLLPSRDRLPVPDNSAVRPPMPVGEFQQSAMTGAARSGVSDF